MYLLLTGGWEETGSLRDNIMIGKQHNALGSSGDENRRAHLPSIARCTPGGAVDWFSLLSREGGGGELGGPSVRV